MEESVEFAPRNDGRGDITGVTLSEAVNVGTRPATTEVVNLGARVAWVPLDGPWPSAAAYASMSFAAVAGLRSFCPAPTNPACSPSSVLSCCVVKRNKRHGED